MERNVKNASKIKLLALDVDGVLTDGSLNIGAEGELFKAFNARDGLGLSCLLRSGVRVAIITGRKSAIIHRRAEELGITELYEGIKDKRKILADLAAAGGLGQEEIAYMGDDLNDLPALLYVGLACAPADAAPEVISASSFVAANNGGRGAVREAAESELRNGVLDTNGLLRKIADEDAAAAARSAREIELLKTIYELKHTINR